MTEAKGSWTEVQIGGHPCDIYEPPGPNEFGFTLIYLHSARLERLTELTSFLDQFSRHSLPVIAPRAQRSWWTDKICPEFDLKITAERHLLDSILPYVQSRWSSESRSGLFGIGMGGQGALRLAYKHPNTFPVVAALAPAIDYQLRYDDDEIIQLMYPDPEAVRQDTATLHIHPLNWPRHQFFSCDPFDHLWWDGVDRLRMKLSSLGVPHECDLETTTEGDASAYRNAMAERVIRYLTEHLDQERRRLV